jgi:hypothetical protein
MAVTPAGAGLFSPVTMHPSLTVAGVPAGTLRNCAGRPRGDAEGCGASSGTSHQPA